MGGTPFHTTQAKAIEFPVAALSPAHRKQAEGEGEALDRGYVAKKKDGQSGAEPRSRRDAQDVVGHQGIAEEALKGGAGHRKAGAHEDPRQETGKADLEEDRFEG